MARTACPQQPGVPLHLVLRSDAADPGACLERLRAAARCPVHAYVLMGTHVHLLLSPDRVAGAMPLIRAVRARDFDATPVYTRRYVLACMRYIELNPVRAGFVHGPAEFRWSSHAHHVGRAVDPVINDHPIYWSLGNTPFERQAAYRRLFEHEPSGDELATIRRSTHGGWLLGVADAVARVTSSRRPVARKAGRPRPASSSPAPASRPALSRFSVCVPRFLAPASAPGGWSRPRSFRGAVVRSDPGSG